MAFALWGFLFTYQFLFNGCFPHGTINMVVLNVARSLRLLHVHLSHTHTHTCQIIQCELNFSTLPRTKSFDAKIIHPKFFDAKNCPRKKSLTQKFPNLLLLLNTDAMQSCRSYILASHWMGPVLSVSVPNCAVSDRICALVHPGTGPRIRIGHWIGPGRINGRWHDWWRSGRVSAIHSCSFIW